MSASLSLRAVTSLIQAHNFVKLFIVNKHWFVSIQVEMELPEPLHPSTAIMGVDMGVKRLFTLSNGINDEDIDGRAINVDFFKQSIKRLQKRLAKKVKFSSN